MKKLFLALSLFGFGGVCFAGTVSYDQLAVSSDLTAAKYNSDLNTIYQAFNSNIESSNIAADTLTEADFADEINPRLRDYERGGDGTECEMVYEGGLVTTTSGTLTGSIPAYVAYPRGYRVTKASNTPHTFTASKWTYIDLDTSNNLQYSEVSISASAPAVAANAIRLCRVSTDGTQVSAVQDLRVLSCTNAKFSTVKETTTEAALDDIFKNGAPVKKTFGSTWATSTPDGYAQGAIASYASHTSFTVSAGGLYINGKYRANDSAVTLTTSQADDPVNGVSGIVSGTAAASTVYNIYGVADQDAVSTFSVSYGAAATGLTNSRLIGQITTDASGLFTSHDVYTAHAVTKADFNDITAKGWIFALGAATPASYDASYNVASLTEAGAGDWTVVWDTDFSSAKYCVVTGNDENIATLAVNSANQAAGSVKITGGGADGRFHVVAYGDQ